MNKKYKNIMILSLALILAPAFAQAEDTTSKSQYSMKAEKAKPYPLDYCIVSDEELGEMGDIIVLIYKGQEMKFCCKPCVKKFKKKPKKYLKALEKAKTKKK